MAWADLLDRYGPGVAGFLQGIDDPDRVARDDPATIVNTVFHGITNGGFRMNGRRTFYTDYLSAGADVPFEGDCGTLADAFLEIMEGLGIQAEQHRVQDCIVAVPCGLPALGAVHPNVDNGMWCFQEHYWVSTCGQEYDLLFGVAATFLTLTQAVVSQDGYGRRSFTSEDGSIVLYRARDSHSHLYTAYAECAWTPPANAPRSSDPSCTIL
ncbi:hypothetical protein ABZW32_16495 [Streptomyces sp. NPDC004667]|uniref:hypothetical protein n=1 Tax=Streptomyces sp. NPDC004667 TaxID=3154285 RepID=UPI0033AC60B1